jgi:hypothetical protein
MRNKAKLQKSKTSESFRKFCRLKKKKPGIIALIDDQSRRMTQVLTKTSRSLKRPNFKRIPKTEEKHYKANGKFESFIRLKERTKKLFRSRRTIRSCS